VKAVQLTGIRQMRVAEVATPKIKKDTDVLLKIEMIGICGSDVHYYEMGKIGSQVVQYPYIVGHECAATVAEVGKKVTRVKPGDAVAVNPAAACHKCDQCKMGRENTCRHLTFLGTPGQGYGCFCEYIVMPQECCFAVTGKLSFEQATICEPFAIGVYSVKQAYLRKDARIAILGSGPIGLSCMVAAKAEGVKAIYVTDKLDYRVEIAKKNGAVWGGNPQKQNIVKEILGKEPLGLEAVFECAGDQAALTEAVALLRPGGFLISVGIPREDKVWFCIDDLRRKEITIVNIRRQNECEQEAIDLVASGKAQVDFMATHKFKLEQTQEGFETVSHYRDGVVKAMIVID
jgi:L-iditol 2-dehydrogenase